MMRQICGALEAAHEENVVHRDLKSDNIMLLDVAEGDWVKVLDFGIAKIQEPDGKDPELTAPNLIIGTPHYMSPEQCSQSSEIDARSDIYSLGVILYELFAGHVPFTGESPTAIMFKHVHEDPPDLLTERSDLSPEVAQIVARALAKEPADRFQSMGELRKSLALAVDFKPTGTGEIVANGEIKKRDPVSSRFVVPTGSGELPADVGEDSDITVVRANTGEEVIAPAPPAQSSNANSWRLAALALLGVLVIGVVLYAMTRNRQAAIDQQTPPLTADPNSQPVKPGGPPTGQAERDVAPTTPSDASNINANSNTSNSNDNQNSNLPGSDGNLNANDNSQQNSNLPAGNNNSNSNGSEPTTGPSPKTNPPKVDVGPPPPPPTPKTEG